MGQRTRGSKRLGSELRRRRGTRSLREIERLSRRPPCAGRIAPLPASSLHQIERGARLPNVEQIRSLSFLYHLPVQDIYALMDAEPEGWVCEEGADFLSLRRQATLFRESDQPGRYLACLLRCEERAETAGDLVWVRRARAQALRQRGQGGDAVTVLLDLLRRSGLPAEELAGIWLDTAEILAEQRNYEVAEAAARRGLDRCHASDALTRARLRAALGRILRQLSLRDGRSRPAREAVRLLESVVESLDELGMLDEKGSAEVELGLAHLAEGSSLQGFELLRRGLATCHRAADRERLSFAHYSLGRALHEGGRSSDAREHLVRAETLAASQGAPEIQFASLVTLCEVERTLDRDDAPFQRRALGLLPWLRMRTLEQEQFEESLRPDRVPEGMPPPAVVPGVQATVS